MNAKIRDILSFTLELSVFGLIGLVITLILAFVFKGA